MNEFISDERPVERAAIWREVCATWNRPTLRKRQVGSSLGMAGNIAKAMGLDPKYGPRTVAHFGLLRRHSEEAFWARYAEIWRSIESSR